VQCGPSASSAALHAAFELLDSPPAPAAASRAAEAAAWSRLQRVAAWWLGANANLAAGENTTLKKNCKQVVFFF
jgi:hypothetical protein